MKLFCLTYAGGTAAFFNQLGPYISSQIELVKYEYAGHGTRHKDAFYTDFHELADEVYAVIKQQVASGESFGLLGYSMGSISLVEILNIIIERNEITFPKYVFLCAHEPLNMDELADFSELEKEEWVKKRTLRFGGIPEKLVNNNSFWRMYLPIYRNDYSMIGRYDFNALQLRTEIPAVIFYSPTDVSSDKMKLWAKYFRGELEFHEYNGTHFFINEHCEEICLIINQKMESKGW